MFRGATTWTVVVVVAAVLFALPFFASSGEFATAHTDRQAEAKDQSAAKLSGKVSRAEAADKRHCDHAGDPTGPLRTRDRDFAPQGPGHPLSAGESTAASEWMAPGEFPLSRPSTAPALTAFQVFRC
ncbi:hypothetical protein OHU27_34985 [Streptomyces nigra]|uniref:Secreted protein n=1 Tax=Streptomyces nigra TaxID=1827580 RepID=A0ABZ1J4U9_9ACTN